MKYSFKNDGNKQLSAHFKVKEFRCKDGTDTILIDLNLITALENLYQYLNKKYSIKSINITSGYRTVKHSLAIGSTKTSQHIKGKAADFNVKLSDGKTLSAEKICIALEDMKYIGGVGYITKTHIHIDTRGYKIYFDETKSMRTTSSWYSYFNIDKPINKPDIVIDTKRYIKTSSAVIARKGIGFGYSRYRIIPNNATCELLVRSIKKKNGYIWDKIIYNKEILYIPNKWNKYL